MPDTSPTGPQDAGDTIGRKSFEEALEELEAIVSQLEAGAKPLDESLALYEKGVGALKHCHCILDKAEKRIRVLVKNARGEPALQDAELPNVNAAKKPPSRRAPAPEDESAASESAEGSKNSVQQSVDSAPPSRQNPNPSVKPKNRTAYGKTDAAGGSLFGSSQ